MALLLNDLSQDERQVILRMLAGMVGETAGPLSLEALLQTVQAPVVRSLR